MKEKIKLTLLVMVILAIVAIAGTGDYQVATAQAKYYSTHSSYRVHFNSGHRLIR